MSRVRMAQRLTREIVLQLGLQDPRCDSQPVEPVERHGAGGGHWEVQVVLWAAHDITL